MANDVDRKKFPMLKCTMCSRKENLSPLRLGHVCGRCKRGKLIMSAHSAPKEDKKVEEKQAEVQPA